MKRNITILLVICTFLCTVVTARSQVIRRNYREWSDTERQTYIDALYTLKTNGVIEQYRAIHEANMMSVHNTNMFVPWHREFIRQFELQLKAVNSSINLPYWDWTSTNPDDRQKTSLLWSDPWLGQFNSDWSLGRCASSCGTLPTAAQIDAVLLISDFDQFAWNNTSGNDLEDYHDIVHGWVGGDMGFLETSPNDPVFYWHHSNVDRIWQKWEDMAGHTSSFAQTSMPPPYQSTNPNNIIDSRALKVWYAVNNLLTLDQYTVSGTETYNYTSGSIVAQTNFTVPATASCTFVAASGRDISLKDGFTATAVGGSGETFRAYINTGGMAPVASRDEPAEKKISKANKRSIASLTNIPSDYFLSINYPNPFNPSTRIAYGLPRESEVSLKVYNTLGQVIKTLVDEFQTAGYKSITFDAGEIPSGVYFYRMTAGNFTELKKMILVK